MAENNTAKTYEVNDVDIAAVLWVLDFKFTEIKIVGETVIWVFDDKDNKITSVYLKYRNQELKIEPVELFHKRRSLLEEAMRLQKQQRENRNGGT